MSLLGRALAGAQRRGLESTLSAPAPWLVDALTGPSTYTGKTVTVDNSLGLVPVFSCVSLLAGAVGSLPLMVYRRLEQGRERAQTHRTWRMLHDQPNPEMAADEFWETMTAYLLLWGNGFAAKMRDSFGQVSELWPLRPSRVVVSREANGRKFFLLDGTGRYYEDDILHIRGLGTDGLVGLSPIQQARQTLGVSMAQEEFAGRFYANSAHPAGILTHPNHLSEEAGKRLKASWKATHAGAQNAGEIAVLEEGMDWKATGMPLEDAQFIETAQFGDLRVAQLFRIPPKMIGAKTGDSLTYKTTESESLDFVRWSLRRWLVRHERALMRDESIFLQGDRFYPEFLVDALLRAESEARAKFYTAALHPQTGWMTRAEVRDLENLNPNDDDIAAPPPPPAGAPTSGE